MDFARIGMRWLGIQHSYQHCYDDAAGPQLIIIAAVGPSPSPSLAFSISWRYSFDDPKNFDPIHAILFDIIQSHYIIRFPSDRSPIHNGLEVAIVTLRISVRRLRIRVCVVEHHLALRHSIGLVVMCRGALTFFLALLTCSSTIVIQRKQVAWNRRAVMLMKKVNYQRVSVQQTCDPE